VQPHQEAGYTSAVVAVDPDQASRCNRAGSIYVPHMSQSPDWMPITPNTGSLFHAETQAWRRRAAKKSVAEGAPRLHGQLDPKLHGAQRNDRATAKFSRRPCPKGRTPYWPQLIAPAPRAGAFIRQPGKREQKASAKLPPFSILRSQRLLVFACSGGILGAEQLQRGLDLGEERLDFGALVRAGSGFKPRQLLLFLS
ncbi:hypothetical protein ABID65_009139, partial [Bradyrhizobium sp. S3.9.2]